jgi:hypothetical protein
MTGSALITYPSIRDMSAGVLNDFLFESRSVVATAQRTNSLDGALRFAITHPTIFWKLAINSDFESQPI